MGVVIEICVKYPGGPTRMTVAGIIYYIVSGAYVCICVVQRAVRSAYSALLCPVPW
jgi:hypothetical protein